MMTTTFVFPDGEELTTLRQVDIQLNHIVDFKNELFRVYSIRHMISDDFERVIQLHYA